MATNSFVAEINFDSPYSPCFCRTPPVAASGYNVMQIYKSFHVTKRRIGFRPDLLFGKWKTTRAPSNLINPCFKDPWYPWKPRNYLHEIIIP